MKKLTAILICLCCLLFGLKPTTVFADEVIDITDAQNFVSQIISNPQRVAGSEQESNTSSILANYLCVYGFIPLFTTYEKSFQYEVDGEIIISQNVIGIKNNNCDKYLIVGAHYDCVGGDNNQGVADNAGGVACALKFAKEYDNANKNYNLIVVFYGAEEVGFCGSKYFLESLPANIKDNILLSVVLDNVGAGDYNYFYTADHCTQYSNIVKQQFKDKIKHANNNSLFTNSSVFGDSYYNMGMMSDNYVYLKQGINSLLLFSGNLNKSTFQFKETNGAKISHVNDNLTTVTNVFGNKFYENITFVANQLIEFSNSEELYSITPNQINTIIYQKWFVKLMGVAVVALIAGITASVLAIKYKRKR